MYGHAYTQIRAYRHNKCKCAHTPSPPNPHTHKPKHVHIQTYMHISQGQVYMSEAATSDGIVTELHGSIL